MSALSSTRHVAPDQGGVMSPHSKKIADAVTRRDLPGEENLY
jgi:hypothetical protein